MSGAISDFLKRVSNTFIFCAAVIMLIYLLDITSNMQKTSNYERNEKESVTMEQLYVDDDKSAIYITGSEVYTDVLSEEKDILVYIGNNQVSDVIRENARQNIPGSIIEIRNMISLNSEYVKKYEFDENNKLIKVTYEVV